MMGHFGYRGRLAVVCLAIAISAPSKSYASRVLISAEEAQRPLPKGAAAMDKRGITRGPRIELVSEPAPVHSPMHLQVKFEAFGGSRIVTDTVKVTYIKDPSVDLTPRLKDFLQPGGIDMPDVQLPVGEHLIRVDLKDSDGRTGVASFILKVEP